MQYPITKYLPVIRNSFLFSNADDTKISHIIDCLEGFVKRYEKHQMIYNLYEKIEYAGIILDGEVHALMVNASNNEYVVQNFLPGDLFCASYACIPAEPSDLQIIAQQECVILFLKLSNLFSAKAIQCPNASLATANLLHETAWHTILQNRKVQILTQKHIRDRFLLYIRSLLKTSPSSTNTVTLPFNRQALANYLGVERTALAREMCNLKEEGIIDFHKNIVTLL